MSVECGEGRNARKNLPMGWFSVEAGPEGPEQSVELPARDTMSEAAFHQIMAVGLAQAKADDSFDFQEVFDELEAGLEDENHLTTEKR